MIPTFIPIEERGMSIFSALLFIALFWMVQNINKKITRLSKKDGALSKCMNDIKLMLKEVTIFSKSHKEVILEMKDDLKDMRKEIQRMPRL